MYYLETSRNEPLVRSGLMYEVNMHKSCDGTKYDESGSTYPNGQIT